MSIPVALFAYNRPKHLALCLEFLENSQAKLEKRLPLYIFCDAPKDLKDRLAVKETQRVADMWVAKYGGAVIKRSSNQGFKNITNGVSALCEKYGRTIVIEDDLLVAPDFLSFMIDGLVQYAQTPQVFMISGFIYHGLQKLRQPTFFLPTAFIWGWATWKRAWDQYLWQPSGVEAFLQNREQRYLFDIQGSFPFSTILEKLMKKECNTWDIQWMYTLFQKKGLSLYPHRSLVWNCGVGGGTHGIERFNDPLQCQKKEMIHGTMSLEDFRKPRLEKRVFPQKIAEDKKALRALVPIFLKERMEKSRSLRLRGRYFYEKIKIR